MTEGMGDFNYSARFRDLVIDITKKTIEAERPFERIGKVFSANYNSQTAKIWFPGTDINNLATVNFGKNMSPNITMDIAYGTLGADAPGDVVRVVGKPGQLWIADYISGAPRVEMGSGALGGIELDYRTNLVVRLATTGQLALNGFPIVDGIQTKTGDRVLAWRQTDPIQNGIYTVGLGTWVRSPEALDDDAVFAGAIIKVIEGNDWGGWRFSASWRHMSGMNQIGGTSIGLRPLSANRTTTTYRWAAGVVNQIPNGSTLRAYQILGFTVPAGALRADIQFPMRGKWATNAACFGYLYTNVGGAGAILQDQIRTHNNADASQTGQFTFTTSVDVLPGQTMDVWIDIANDLGSGSWLILMESRLMIKWIGGRG